MISRPIRTDEDLRAAFPGFHCNLFAQVPDNLDEGWGGGCALYRRR